MNASNNNHQNRNTKKEFSSLQYLMVSLLFLVIMIFLLFMIVGRHYSPNEQALAFYLTILIASMAFAAFIFGTMRSYARWKGIESGGNLELAGPIVGAALVVVGGYYFMANSPYPAKPEHALLKFKMEIDKDRPSNSAMPPSTVSYKQNKPVPQDRIKLALQDSGWYVRELADLPKCGERYLSKIRRESEEPIPTNMLPNLVTELCFKRKSQHKELPKYETEFICVEGDGCDSEELADTSWYEMCESPVSGHIFNLVTTTYAFQDDMQAGWIVPSLDTLCRRQKNHKASFTYFKIQSGPLAGLDQVDSITYQVFANDTPIYFDGWPREDTITAVKPQKGITLEFGLENLNFSGANEGQEIIRTEFDFYSKKKPIKRLTIERSYVALREVEPVSVTKDGIDFRWTGDYFIGKDQDGFKVNIWSTTDPRELVKRKKWFDRAEVEFEGRSSVSVIRPPLEPNPSYGLAIGLVDKYDRIKFTFSQAEAERISSWVKNNLRSVRVTDLKCGLEHPIVRSKGSSVERLKGIPNQDKMCNW